MISDRFGVLFVCHANLCRSPMAERLACRAFADRLDADAAQLVVGSAGTHARAGLAMHPGAVRALGERGIDADGFASRPVTPDLIAGADLVLTATRAQRAACVTLDPASVRYTFTLRQFGRMSAGLVGLGTAGLGTSMAVGAPAVRLRVLLDEVVLSRSRLQPTDPSEDDLADPVGGSAEDFRVCAVEIQRCVDAMIGIITAP
jgi:protein-tyrosine phosphatase